MAAPSPALSSNSSDTTTTATATAAVATSSSPAAASAAIANAFAGRADTPPKTLRGLNKPKCKQCGNVARSRCPYESCKSCCAKAQNPCHIHVLKANATFTDKAPASSSPLFDQQSTEPSSSVSSHRIASFRQLSSTFSQFNSVQAPLRSRKPLTRKDAAAINEWRFSKLKEYNERNIEVENEAFDRYIQNVGLLEEIFSPNSPPDGLSGDESSTSDHDPNTIIGLKPMLRSNASRINNFRKRIRQIVDQGLENLKRRDLDDHDHGNGPVDRNESEKEPKREKDWRAERASTLSDLIDKLDKARNEEDLKPCLEIKSQIFDNQSEPESDPTATNDLKSKPETTYSYPKLITAADIDHETLVAIDAHFSSVEKIANL